MALGSVQYAFLQAAGSVAPDKQTSVFFKAEVIGGFKDTLHIFKMPEYGSNPYVGMVGDLLCCGHKVALFNQLQHRLNNQLATAVTAHSAAIGFVVALAAIAEAFAFIAEALTAIAEALAGL